MGEYDTPTRPLCPECMHTCDIGGPDSLMGQTPTRCIRSMNGKWIWCVTKQYIKLYVRRRES